MNNPKECSTNIEQYKYTDTNDTSTNINHQVGKNDIIIIIISIVIVGVVLYNPITSAIYSALAIILCIATYMSIKFYINPIEAQYMYSYMFSIFYRNPPYVPFDFYFPEHTILEQNFKTIQEEMFNVMEHYNKLPFTRDTFNGENAYIGSDNKGGGGWKVYTIMLGDYFSRDAEKRCPKLIKLIQSINQQTPGLIRTCLFSIMDGHRKIPIHIGYNKIFLRYQLCLKIPKDSTPKKQPYLCVNGEKYNWEEGKGILFDDTYSHKVHNPCEDLRIVMYMDIQRRISNPILHKINTLLINIGMNHKDLKDEIDKIDDTLDL